MNIWDFSGKKEAAKIRSEFYRESDGIIYVFDLTDHNTFISLEFWLKECKKYGGDKLIPLVVGNKSDNERVVQYCDIKKFCDYNKLTFQEVSAKNGTNVIKVITEYSKIIYEMLPK